MTNHEGKGSREEERAPEEARSASDIAVIGMAGRFPKAPDLETFWHNIASGIDCTSRFGSEELAASGVPEALRRRPDFVPVRAVLEGAEMFDAAFFGMSPAEADVTDPQHRVLLEVAWETLENAGYDPGRYEGMIGVYAGADANLYAATNMVRRAQDIPAILGNNRDYLTTRIAFKLDLRGPCLTLQTACSTSLVAVQVACRALLDYQCDMALAGGVGIQFPQKAGYVFQEGGVMSPDGVTRTFDARGRGTVSGDGCGMVLLKRLTDALADGDTVVAVIKGAAINNDGSDKVGFMAPSVAGQAEVVALAQAAAGVPAETITLMEAHGTATELGDPVEITALDEVFGAATEARGFCAIGSVKSNVGHLNSASGIAGLLKVVLALSHRQIPPSLHFEKPNPQIDFERSCFRVATALRPWAPRGFPRRAAVSSFGVGGTNAHAVLEEAPPLPATTPGREHHLLLVSGKTEQALDDATARLAAHLESHPEQDLSDVSFTLLAGRKLHKHRRMAVVRRREEASAAILGAPASLQRETTAPPVVLMFPGQGSQYAGMAKGLHEREPVFRAELDRAADMVYPALKADLRKRMFEPGEEGLDDTAIAQVAIFAVSHALARTWMAWGVEPQAMLGHSVGEYVAACLSGVLTLEDALTLLVARGRLVAARPKGAMIAAEIDEDEARAFGRLSIAALNGPKLTVLSGPIADIEEASKVLSARKVAVTRLRTSHAFHSSMLDAALPAFRKAVEKVTLSEPQIPYLSNVTGTWISAAEATDPDYWVRHLRRPVRFWDALQQLESGEARRVYLEAGPGRTLGALLDRASPSLAAPGAVSPLASRAVRSMRGAREGRDDQAVLVEALGKLAVLGVPVDWKAVFEGQKRRRVPLPAYPFQRERHMTTFPSMGAAAGEGSGQSAASQASRTQSIPDKKTDVRTWPLVTGYRRSSRGPEAPSAPGAWLVHESGHPLGGAIADAATRLGAAVRRVGLEEAAGAAAIESLLAGLGGPPVRVVHALLAGDAADFEEAQSKGLVSVLAWARAWAKVFPREPMRMAVVTSGVVDALGTEPLAPSKATVLGACQVLSQEMLGWDLRVVDVALGRGAKGGGVGAAGAEAIAREIAAPDGPRRVALREGGRWVPFHAAAEPGSRITLRRGGTYLLTGGLGEMGLTLAEHLARRGAKLALTSRGGLVAREEWDAWLAGHGANDPTSRRIARIRAMEAAGAEVLALSADVADRARMQHVIDRVHARFGEIHGVIHLAGVAGSAALAPAIETDAERCRALLRPKAGGARVLAELLPDTLDFVALCSSISTELGGSGLAAYAATNHALDAIAIARRRDGGTPWVSVAWDAWAGRDHGGLGAMGLPVVSPGEGGPAFEAALAAGEPRVVVSVTDLDERRKAAARWSALAAAQRAARPADGARHPRPALETPYAPPSNELEEKIAEMWRQLFGLDRVGIHDNFFTLGGDSLRAIQLGSQIKETFGVELSVNHLFEQPTVASLARNVAAAQSAQNEPGPSAAEGAGAAKGAGAARADAALDMIEQLSDDEVRKLLELAERDGGGS